MLSFVQVHAHRVVLFDEVVEGAFKVAVCPQRFTDFTHQTVFGPVHTMTTTTMMMMMMMVVVVVVVVMIMI
jgi:hypothetical protein